MKTWNEAIAVMVAGWCVAASLADASERRKFEITPQQAMAEQARKEADIRAEANAPGLDRRSRERVMNLLAAGKQKAAQEMAEDEKFKHAQQIELAQASAAKIYVVNNSVMPSQQAPADLHKAGYVRTSLGGKGAGVQKVKAAFQGTGALGMDELFLKQDKSRSAAKEPPVRFYKRQVLERSADQIVQSASEASNAAARENAFQAETGTPFASPVPGRPGYVTSPPQNGGGMIDARGYNPGSAIRDPYTNQIIRVP